jgi:hypothetical protein
MRRVGVTMGLYRTSGIISTRSLFPFRTRVFRGFGHFPGSLLRGADFLVCLGRSQDRRRSSIATISGRGGLPLGSRSEMMPFELRRRSPIGQGRLESLPHDGPLLLKSHQFNSHAFSRRSRVQDFLRWLPNGYFATDPRGTLPTPNLSVTD